MEWEYMRDIFRYEKFEDEGLENWLNIRGQYRWECYHVEKNAQAKEYVCYFRRETSKQGD